MNGKFILLATAGLLILSCKAKKPIQIEKTGNPVFYPNTVFESFEDLSSPKFIELKEKYQADTVFHGENDELKRILLLRNWIRSVITINDPGPHPGDGSADSILHYALKGNGYHCGHFMAVQNAIMNAYGYVTRCLGAGPGGQDGKDGHHGINEIWLNSYHKWFLSDAKYNHHFEKNGVPLSALEIRDEYLKNRAADVIMVNGPARTPVEFDTAYQTSKEHFARTYVWIEWESVNNRFTHWPENSNELSKLIMYEDDYFKKNTWIWDGKPHWAYNTKSMIRIADRNAIEWTPNTITSNVVVKDDSVQVDLKAVTPNFKTYQMKDSRTKNWRDILNPVKIPLEAKESEFIFRTMNIANVSGPEYKVFISK